MVVVDEIGNGFVAAGVAPGALKTTQNLEHPPAAMEHGSYDQKRHLDQSLNSNM